IAGDRRRDDDDEDRLRAGRHLPEIAGEDVPGVEVARRGTCARVDELEVEWRGDRVGHRYALRGAGTVVLRADRVRQVLTQLDRIGRRRLENLEIGGGED